IPTSHAMNQGSGTPADATPADATRADGASEAAESAREAAPDSGAESAAPLGPGPVVSRPDAAAATAAELLPRTADHVALFQDIPGQELDAWATARSLASELDRLAEAWDKADYPTELIGRLRELGLLTDGLEVAEIGRASCRESVGIAVGGDACNEMRKET